MNDLDSDQLRSPLQEEVSATKIDKKLVVANPVRQDIQPTLQKANKRYEAPKTPTLDEMFAHSKQKKVGKDQELQQIKKCLIDLYLSVKIRKNEEIDQYDSAQLSQERHAMASEGLSCMDLIGYVQTSIEILMKLKNEQDQATAQQCRRCKRDIKETLVERKRNKEGLAKDKE